MVGKTLCDYEKKRKENTIAIYNKLQLLLCIFSSLLVF